MRIESIYRYPVKGLTAEALEEVMLTPGATLPDDRRFALAQGDSSFDPAAPAWLPKRNFGCLMVNARLALVHSAYDGRSGELALRFPDEPIFVASTRTKEGRAAIAARLAGFMGEEARGTPRFLEAPAIPSRTSRGRSSPSSVCRACMRWKRRRARASIRCASVPMSTSRAASPGPSSTGSGRKSSSARRGCAWSSASSAARRPR